MTTSNLPTEALRQSAMERLRHGRVIVTIKSLNTGDHITLRIHGKNRHLKTRYCNLADAAIVAVDCGRLSVRTTGEGDEKETYTLTAKVGWFFASSFASRPDLPVDLRANVGADPRRLQVAQRAVNWLKGAGPLWTNCEVALSDHCSRCGRTLSDPESRRIGTGPECRGKTTSSHHQERVL